MIKKGAAIFISFMCIFSFLSACKFDEGIDKTKTQLYIGNYDGGLGHEWIEKTAALFEEKFKDVSFEDGKKGVEIVIDNGKDNMSGNTLLADMPSSRDSVFFTESVDYYDLISRGVVADITKLYYSKTKWICPSCSTAIKQNLLLTNQVSMR